MVLFDTASQPGVMDTEQLDTAIAGESACVVDNKEPPMRPHRVQATHWRQGGQLFNGMLHQMRVVVTVEIRLP